MYSKEIVGEGWTAVGGDESSYKTSDDQPDKATV